MSNESSHDQNVQRRDFIKALATVPVFGFFLANLWLKLKKDALKRKNLLVDLVQEKKPPTVIKKSLEWKAFKYWYYWIWRKRISFSSRCRICHKRLDGLRL